MIPLHELDNGLGAVLRGDAGARGNFIQLCRGFIIKAVEKVCRRPMKWGQDDEISVGLMAFDEAIERYCASKGVPFLAFARMIIKSRITDYMRQQARYTNVNYLVSHEAEIAEAEYLKAWEHYWNSQVSMERLEEIREFQKLLAKFGISFRDMVKSAPRHEDTRQRLLEMSRLLAQREDLFNKVLKNNRLPVGEISTITGYSRKTIGRGRKYIIAASIILRHCGEYPFLCQYLEGMGN